MEAFPIYFLDAFRAAFPNIALLVGETIDPTEAWGYVSQMLGKQPESSSTQALEGSVGQLLPHLDTASLRAAPAQERVAEMQKLMRQMNADTGADKMVTTPGDAASGTEAISTLDSAAWARILQQPTVRALLACLEIHGHYSLRYVSSGSAFCVPALHLQTTLWGPIRTPYPHSVSASVFWAQLRIPYPHFVSVSVFWGQLRIPYPVRIPYPYFGASFVFRIPYPYSVFTVWDRFRIPYSVSVFCIYGLGQVPYSVFRIHIPYLRFGTGSVFRIPCPYSVFTVWDRFRTPYSVSVFRIYGLGQVPYSVFRVRIPYLRFGTGSVLCIPYPYSVFSLTQSAPPHNANILP